MKEGRTGQRSAQGGAGELDATPTRSIGLVLSGGGARGAYEVGTLLHIADELPDLLSRVRVISGTSVGAVNGTYLASKGLTPQAVRDLAAIWRSLDIDHVVGFNPRQASQFLTAGGLRLIGKRVPSPAAGLFSVEGISKLVGASVDWKGLRHNVRCGRFDAVSVAATDVASGDTLLFVAHEASVVPHWSVSDPTLVPRRVVLRPHHVLASAAIPILFPPVRVSSRWFVDGGIRYNTPLSPALSLGSDALLIVSVRAAASARVESPPGPEFPGIGQVIGKLLDSMFLDRVAWDLDRLARINEVVSALETVDPSALPKLQDELIRRGRRPYRYIPFAEVRPSYDLGALAAEHLRRAAKASRLSFARLLKMLFLDDTGTTGDAASFLLFDGQYAEELMRAGREDAAAAHDQLSRL